MAKLTSSSLNRFVHASKWDNMSVILLRRLLFIQSDVGARRLSATKHMRLFQQPASLVLHFHQE
jgi:hypothetical protein